MSVRVALSVEVWYVKVNQQVTVIFVVEILTQVMSCQVNLLVQAIFLSLIRNCQLKRRLLHF